jgi:hypothetical protein
MRDELLRLLSTYAGSAAGEQCGLHVLLSDLHVVALERGLDFWEALTERHADQTGASLDAFDAMI